MAVHPLRPATDRRFGGPLPRQLANQTRTHPVPMNLFTQGEAPSCAYAVLPAVSSCYPPVRGRLSTRYSPVRHYDIFQTEIIYISPFDLHVLGTPPAFILSQDQTLMLNKISCYTGYQSQVQFCAVERGSGQELLSLPFFAFLSAPKFAWFGSFKLFSEVLFLRCAV